MKLSVLCAAAIFAVISDPSTAAAGGVPCALVEPDFVAVDGILDDWRGIKGKKVGGAGADASLELRCAHDEAMLYVAVIVRDDRVIRTGKGRTGQDRLSLNLGQDGGRTLVALPGTRGFAPEHTWAGGRLKDPAAAENALQENGWALEVALPLKSLRGWGRGTPALRYDVRYRDFDSNKDKVEIRDRGVIEFAGSREVYQSFMQQVGLTRKQVKVDVLAEVDGGRGVERVIVGGRVIGVLNDEYRYVALPIERDADLIKAKVVDLSGDGKSSVITHYRQHGNGGSRDVVAVWSLREDGKFIRTLAVEVRKEADGNSLTNTWRLEKGKKGAIDLIVEVGEVVGWDERTFNDVPPEDMQPILTPWGDQQSAVFHFEGDTSFGGEPLSKR